MGVLFKSEQVEVHCSFLKTVNLELRMAVFNFFRFPALFVFEFFFFNFRA